MVYKMKFTEFRILTEKKVFGFKSGVYIIVDPKLVMSQKDFGKLSVELDNTPGNALEYEYSGITIAAFKLSQRMGDYPSNYNNKEVEVTSGKIVVMPRDLIPDNKFEKEELATKAIVTNCKNNFECTIQKNILKVGNLTVDISEENSIADNTNDPNQNTEK